MNQNLNINLIKTITYLIAIINSIKLSFAEPTIKRASH